MGGLHRPPEPATQPTAAAAGGEIPTVVIVFVGFLTTLLIVSVTVLTVLDKPVDNVLIIVGAFIAPTVGSLLATRKLSQVAKQVNGKMDNLITDKAILENQVTALGDIPATLPARRATDTAPQIQYPPKTTEIRRNGR